MRLDPKALGFLELPAVVLHEAEQRVSARLRPEASVLRGKIGAACELPLRPGELAEVEEGRSEPHVCFHQHGPIAERFDRGHDAPQVRDGGVGGSIEVGPEP